MNDCVNGEMRDVLPELVNGTLPAGEIARVQAHVRECADCAAEVELLRTARAALRLAPTMDTARISAAVQTSTAQRLAARSVPARVARIAGLSLIVLAGAIGLWSTRERSLVETKSAVVESQAAHGPVQLALGGDVSQLEDEQLVALMDELSALEAMPGAEPAPLAIEPVVPFDPEGL